MLKSGLYEQVINDELGQKLDAATDKLSQTAPIDSAEAFRVLAKYVTEIIEKASIASVIIAEICTSKRYFANMLLLICKLVNAICNTLTQRKIIAFF